MEEKDTYLTIKETAEYTFRERSSRFMSFAYHIEREEEIKPILDALRKEYYDATHHCYAWRLGPKGEQWRANDDGEPSGTAGKPIYGQLLSQNITNCLIVVVRYFGGTKLGVPGLIQAYRESAQAVLQNSIIEERTVDDVYEVSFSYITMNDVMKIVKDENPKILSQEFDNLCTMRLSQRKSLSEKLYNRLQKVEGITVEKVGYDYD